MAYSNELREEPERRRRRRRRAGGGGGGGGGSDRSATPLLSKPKQHEPATRVAPRAARSRPRGGEVFVQRAAQAGLEIAVPWTFFPRDATNPDVVLDDPLTHEWVWRRATVHGAHYSKDKIPTTRRRKPCPWRASASSSTLPRATSH